LNGNLITTASNTQTITTDITTLKFGQNYSQGYIRGYGADMRFYARELSANEVLSLYETTGGIDYNMTVSLEEID
jgi:hypothetical protein